MQKDKQNNKQKSNKIDWLISEFNQYKKLNNFRHNHEYRKIKQI